MDLKYSDYKNCIDSCGLTLLNRKASYDEQLRAFLYYHPQKHLMLNTPFFKNFKIPVNFNIMKIWGALPQTMRTPNNWGIVLGIYRRKNQWLPLDDAKLGLLMNNPSEAWKYCDHWFEVHERTKLK